MKSNKAVRPGEASIVTREQLAKDLAFLVVQALRHEQQQKKHDEQETQSTHS